MIAALNRATARRGAAWAGFIIIVGVVTLPTISAAPHDVAADLDVRGRAVYQGHHDLLLHHGGIVHHSSLIAGDVSLEIDIRDATLQLVNFPRQVPGALNLNLRLDLPPEEHYWRENVDGRIQLTEAHPTLSSYRIMPLNGKDLTMGFDGDTGFTVSPPFRVDEQPGSGWTDFGEEIPQSRMFPPGSRGLVSFHEEQPITWSGPLFLFLFGGSFDIERPDGSHQTLWTGEDLNQTRSPIPPGNAADIPTYDRKVLMINARNATVTMGGPDHHAWLVAAKTLTGHLDGDLLLHDSTGPIRVDGKSQDRSQQLVQVIGQINASSAYHNKFSTWKLEGAGTFVGIDAQTVAGQRSGEATTAMGVAAGVGILGLLWALLTQTGREVLTFIVGRNIANPLGNETRIQMLRIIRESPGMSRMDLARKLEIARGTVTHHARILERAHLIETHLMGSIPTYFLNGGSLRFKASVVQMEEIPNDSKNGHATVQEIFAQLHHPMRRMILQAILNNGPSNHADMVQYWKSQGLGRRIPDKGKVSYHCRRMQQAGLLARTQEGRNVTWAIAVDLEAAHAHHLQSLITMQGFQPVLDYLAKRGASTDRQIFSAMNDEPDTKRSGLRTTRDLLRRMEALGFVNRDQEDGTYRLIKKGLPHQSRRTPTKATPSSP